ncbi:hypothetical protein cce_4892 [Crocosphaera subtropica ATCC 51142]|uniref:Uncharacterized protein n=2 Tax=Cyanobacteriota TaxID=1117 RepID=B1X277_CROS5|nr:hypothetical protein cce_4892 [Crocosphaera subtropica ATCC 51142]
MIFLQLGESIRSTEMVFSLYLLKIPLMAKPNKRKITTKREEIDEIESQEDLLIRQENTWRNHSTVYDEIREDCRLDSLDNLGNVHYQHPDGDYLCEVEDISEDYLDYLLGYE